MELHCISLIRFRINILHILYILLFWIVCIFCIFSCWSYFVLLIFKFCLRVKDFFDLFFHWPLIFKMILDTNSEILMLNLYLWTFSLWFYLDCQGAIFIIFILTIIKGKNYWNQRIYQSIMRITVFQYVR